MLKCACPTSASFASWTPPAQCWCARPWSNSVSAREATTGFSALRARSPTSTNASGSSQCTLPKRSSTNLVIGDVDDMATESMSGSNDGVVIDLSLRVPLEDLLQQTEIATRRFAHLRGHDWRGKIGEA